MTSLLLSKLSSISKRFTVLEEKSVYGLIMTSTEVMLWLKKFSQKLCHVYERRWQTLHTVSLSALLGTGYCDDVDFYDRW